MSLDHYVTLGASGLRVSPLCLGGMTFGEERGYGTSVEASKRIIDRFLERGGNFIDTANSYNCGHSEEIIGEHIGFKPAVRHRCVLSSKFGFNLYPGDPNGGGANYKSIVSACEQSLRRLRTDYLDLYWMHYWDKFTPVDETMRALDSLVATGKVRYLGFSDTPAWKVVEAQLKASMANRTPLIALQLEYSLLEREIEAALVPMAEEFGLGIAVWSPLKSGILSGKYARSNAAGGHPDRGALVTDHLNDQAFKVIDVLTEIAGRLQSTPARVALAWIRSRPGVTTTIIGARTLDQLEENLSSLELELQQGDLAQLNEVSQPKLPWPHALTAAIEAGAYSGTTISGESFPISPLGPQRSAEQMYPTSISNTRVQSK